VYIFEYVYIIASILIGAVSHLKINEIRFLLKFDGIESVWENCVV